eukprot:12634780-Heterocapsa_arctica.AAC.1
MELSQLADRQTPRGLLLYNAPALAGWLAGWLAGCLAGRKGWPAKGCPSWLGQHDCVASGP